MKLLRAIFTVFTISFLFYSCSGNPFINLDALKENLNIKEFPEQKDYPEADALVLTELHDVSLKIDSNYDLETVEKVQKAVKLFKNIDKYASVEISFLGEDKLSELKARTIKPDGTVVELKSEDFHTIVGHGGDDGYYSDEKTIKFTFPAVEKNCIIEYEYFIEEFYPFVTDVWHLQGSIPKLQNIYKLTVPEILVRPRTMGGVGWNWKYKTSNCTLPQPEFQRNNDPGEGTIDKSVTFSWEQKDVPGFNPEPMMPPYSNYLQSVKFAPSKWEKWNDISGW